MESFDPSGFVVAYQVNYLNTNIWVAKWSIFVLRWSFLDFTGFLSFLLKKWHRLLMLVLENTLAYQVILHRQMMFDPHTACLMGGARAIRWLSMFCRRNGQGSSRT